MTTMNQCVAPPTAKELSEQMAKASAAVQKLSTNTDPECLKCAEEAEIQAVILYPALGTPYVAPADEKKIRLFLIVEDKCVKEFGIDKGDARHAWYYIDTHLRLLPFKTAAKTSADLKGKKLYSSKDAAKAGIKVWYKGVHGEETYGKRPGWNCLLTDHSGHIVAKLHDSAVAFYVNTPPQSAFESKDQVCDTTNHPLRHLFEIELDIQGLRLPPKPDQMYTLAWLVTCVYKNENAAFLEKVSHWEHQDKLVYDFFFQMRKNKKHFAKPFVFDLEGLKPDVWPKQKEDELHRLKPFHPVIFKNGRDRLDIGHLTDIHVSSRQFALARADAAILEGISEPLGAKVVNCLASCANLFDKFQSGADKVDAVFVTGDLLDFNRNLNPMKVSGASPKEQWPCYNLAGKVDNAEYYPRGLDDMLFYSLVRRAYENDMPVFMVTGNHEAYDEPYGISPRVNSYAAKLSANPNRRAKTVEDVLGASKRHEPEKRSDQYDPNQSDGGVDFKNSPNFSVRRANEGIPADHNLTIYEACLIYGPTFPQIMQSWNYMPDNYEWFFMLFTPLSDFVIPYKDQLFTGLEWGDAERMLEGAYVPDSLLPRSTNALNPWQLDVLKNAIGRCAKQHLVFSHFTVVNYGQDKPYSDHASWDIEKFDNELTSGTFERGREVLIDWISSGKIMAHFSGHSHRSGGYKIAVRNGAVYGRNIHVQAHDPAKQPKNSEAQLWVSSCAGGIGIQNLCGELSGWNLMPPSGSRLEAKTGKVGIVVANGVKRNKPRFAVALDYVQFIKGKRVVEWLIRPGDCVFTMFVRRVKGYVPFIRKVTFYSWHKKNKEFEIFDIGLEASVEKVGNYSCKIGDMVGLLSALCTSLSFVKIDFDNSLSKVSEENGALLYDHFDFNDAWIFKVVGDVSGTVSYDPKGETPDYDWLTKRYPQRYPGYKTIVTERRGGR